MFRPRLLRNSSRERIRCRISAVLNRVRAWRFLVSRLGCRVVLRYCWREECRSTRQTGFRPAQRGVGGKDFPLEPCSIPLVLPARRRPLHPYNASAPASTRHQSRVLPLRVCLGATAEILEKVDRQIEYSSWSDEKLVGVVSPASLPLSWFESRHLMQVEWRCTAKESFPEEPQAMR